MSTCQTAKWFVLANVAVGTFMATLDGSVVNLALPTIAKEFGVGMDQIQWVVSGYMLTISSFLLLFGRLGDVLGKGRVYNNGFLIFVIGSALCGMADNNTQLVAARVVQAIGASVLMACGMGIVTQVFPPQERGKALGTMGTVVAMGSLTGPALGGLIVGKVGWEYIFYINVPIGILGFLLGLKYLPKDKPEQRETVDYFGAILFACSVILLILGLNTARGDGWLGTKVLSMLATASILLTTFVHWQLKTKSPLININLFKNVVFTSGIIASGLSFIAIFFSNILMPFYLTEILYVEPERLGLMMMAFPVAMAVTSPLSGSLSDKFGPRPMAVAGMGIQMLALYMLSTVDENTSFYGVILRMGLIGVSIGLFQSPNNSSIMGSVAQRFLGVAGSVVSVVRNVGMVLGISVSVTLFYQIRESHLRQAFSSSEAFLIAFKQVLLIAVGIAFVGMLLSAVRPTKLQEKNVEVTN